MTAWGMTALTRFRSAARTARPYAKTALGGPGKDVLMRERVVGRRQVFAQLLLISGSELASRHFKAGQKLYIALVAADAGFANARFLL